MSAMTWAVLAVAAAVLACSCRDVVAERRGFATLTVVCMIGSMSFLIWP